MAATKPPGYTRIVLDAELEKYYRGFGADPRDMGLAALVVVGGDCRISTNEYDHPIKGADRAEEIAKTLIVWAAWRRQQDAEEEKKA